MKDLLQPRVQSLRVFPSRVREEAFSAKEVDTALREDLVKVANSGFWGTINTPEDLATLADKDSKIVIVGHQPLIGISASIHAKYLAAGLERIDNRNRRLVVVNFVTDVDKVGNEAGAFDVEIPSLQKDGFLIVKKVSPFGQVFPSKDSIYAQIEAPTVEQTQKFLDKVAQNLATLTTVFPESAGSMGTRISVIYQKMIEKMPDVKSLSEWSTLLRHIIYEECGIRVIEVGEKDFLSTDSALTGLAYIIRNADRWFSSHRQVIDTLSAKFPEEVEHGVFPGPRREVVTNLGNVVELPVWILAGNSRVRAGLLHQEDRISVVSLTGSGNLNDGLISFLHAGIGEKFDLGSLADLADTEVLIKRIKENGLDKRWAWDVISFTYLVRNIFRLPYISGRGGARYDVVTENIALALEDRDNGGKIVFNKNDLNNLGSELFWVGIPDEKKPRHRSSRKIYMMAMSQQIDMKKLARKLFLEISGSNDYKTRKELSKKKERIENLLPEVERVISSTPSLLEMYLVGGKEAVLSILTAVEKYEDWLSRRQGLKIGK